MSVGSLGYDDYQAQESYDDVAAWFTLTTAQVANQVSPVVDCSRWANTITNAFATVGQYQLQYDWFIDQAATMAVGRRQIFIDSAITISAQISTLNLGPWIRASVNCKNGNTPYTPAIRSLFTNRVHPLSSYPVFEYVIINAGFTILANSSVTVPAAEYFGGPVGLLLKGGNQGVTYSIQSLSFNFGYQEFFSLAVAANATVYQSLTLPGSANQVVSTNASAVNPCTNATVLAVPNIAGV